MVKLSKQIQKITLYNEILKQLYEMDVHIEEIRGQRICLYYDEDTFDSLL